MILPGCRDLTGYGIARTRPKLSSVEAYVVHRCSLEHVSGLPSDPAIAVPVFYASTAEGVATVTVPGSYKSKLPIIDKWKRDGIPPDRQGASFCAYTLGVMPDGRWIQWLPLDAAGAHAGGRIGRVAVNRCTVSIAWYGEFRSVFEMTKDERRTLHNAEPTPESVDSLRKMLAALDDLVGPRPVRTHSEVNEMTGTDVDEDGRSRKRCPGAQAMVPLERVRSWLEVRRCNVADKARW